MLACDVLQTERLTRLISVPKDLWGRPIERKTPYHLLVYWGLEYILRRWIKEREETLPLRFHPNLCSRVDTLILDSGNHPLSSKITDDERDAHGRTPLSYAAETGQDTVVQLLLVQNGINADNKDEKGRTPLCFASSKGHIQIVNTLIAQEEVDVNSRNNKGWTPLSNAGSNGHVEVVNSLLVREEVDINSTNDNGQTPLLLAANKGGVRIVNALLARDRVDVNSKYDEGQTLLSLASSMGDLKLVNALQHGKMSTSIAGAITDRRRSRSQTKGTSRSLTYF